MALQNKLGLTEEVALARAEEKLILPGSCAQ